NCIVFAASGSNVQAGASDIIGPNGTQEYIWDASLSLWCRVGLVPAQPFALYDGELASTSGGTLTTNTCYFVGVYTPAPLVLTALRCRFSIGGNGNYDIGIYNAAGT